MRDQLTEYNWGENRQKEVSLLNAGLRDIALECSVLMDVQLLDVAVSLAAKLSKVFRQTPPPS